MEHEKKVEQLMERVIRIEAQFERFISDAESEKRTRRIMIDELKQIANRLDNRLLHVEKFVYIALGAVAIIEFTAKLLIK